MSIEEDIEGNGYTLHPAYWIEGHGFQQWMRADDTDNLAWFANRPVQWDTRHQAEDPLNAQAKMYLTLWGGYQVEFTDVPGWPDEPDWANATFELTDPEGHVEEGVLGGTLWQRWEQRQQEMAP